MNVLITGGAGFIGRHVARQCLRQGHAVEILDNYSPQIHGNRRRELVEHDVRAFILESCGLDRAEKLNLTYGDVCSADDLRTALRGKEAVVHLAAETGTGQSMYELSRYERVNIGGTALLAEALVSGQFPQIRNIVLASSRAVYGEGQYVCATCGPICPPQRSGADLARGQFEPTCKKCNGPLCAVPTPEDAEIHTSSFYGLTKAVQENILTMFADRSSQSLFVLRYQNVFGATQSLHNPYTGIISIFSNLAQADKPINIFEDGLESRDFVYVDDVADATARCLEQTKPGIVTLNIGSGVSTTVADVAHTICRTIGSRSAVTVTGQFRIGDIRHARADILAARRTLGFEPTISFAEGIGRFLAWARTQGPVPSRYEDSLSELAEKGLLRPSSRSA